MKSYTGKPFDIISIGDCGMDVFLGLNTVGSRTCSIDTKECWLKLSYADKVEADFQVFATGGNSANLSIGASRLGLKVGFYTELGKDFIGDIVVDTLKKDKVDPKFIRQRKELQSNFHIVLNHEAERTIIVYHNKRTYQLPKLPNSEWIYYSSMGEGFDKIHAGLVKHVKKNKVKLGFNPGTIQFRGGYKKLKSVLQVTELLILNVEEGHRLLGLKHNGIEIKSLMKKMLAIGPKKVIVTDGSKGAYAYDGKQAWYMGIIDVPVVERTGAGDAFSTGCISAMAYGKSMGEALRWGQFSSSSVIQEVGPQAGLLKKTVMNKMLKQYKDLQAEEI